MLRNLVERMSGDLKYVPTKDEWKKIGDDVITLDLDAFAPHEASPHEASPHEASPHEASPSVVPVVPPSVVPPREAPAPHETKAPISSLFRCANALVLSSGGIKGTVLLGSLYYLQSTKQYSEFLQNIHVFSGSSVGCIISYLMIIGFSPLEIISDLFTNPLKLDHAINFTSILKNEGLYKWSMIEDKIRQMTLKKLKYIPTLEDIYTTYKKILICTTYNKTKNKLIYMTSETHGGLSILTVLKMACAIPIVFEEFVYRGDVYIDGAIADHLPVKMTDDYMKRYILENTVDSGVSFDPGVSFETYSILALNIKRKPSKKTHAKKQHVSKDTKFSFGMESIIDFLSNIYSIIDIPMSIIEKTMTEGCSKNVKIINIEPGPAGMFDFVASVKNMLSLFVHGYRKCKEVL